MSSRPASTPILPHHPPYKLSFHVNFQYKATRPNASNLWTHKPMDKKKNFRVDRWQEVHTTTSKPHLHFMVEDILLSWPRGKRKPSWQVVCEPEHCWATWWQSLNPKPLNPKLLNLKPLNPEPYTPKAPNYSPWASTLHQNSKPCNLHPEPVAA